MGVIIFIINLMIKINFNIKFFFYIYYFKIEIFIHEEPDEGKLSRPIL